MDLESVSWSAVRVDVGYRVDKCSAIIENSLWLRDQAQKFLVSRTLKEGKKEEMATWLSYNTKT